MDKTGNNTKELFLYKALELFAEKGYDAVSVAEIAKGVGCTAPALYKHYSGKRALFDAIIEKSKEAYSRQMDMLSFARTDDAEAKERYLNMTVEEQVDLVKGIFMNTAHDRYTNLFRKFMTIEQFKHPELGRIYNERYIESQLKAYSELMKLWIDAGIMRGFDPYIMALEYISPLTILVTAYDREPYNEGKYLAILEQHVRQFNQIYALPRRI